MGFLPEELLKKFAEEEKRYNAEKKDIEKEAKTLEHERDRNRDKDPYFDYAEVLLQIAIVMASVSILSASPGRRSPATYIGVCRLGDHVWSKHCRSPRPVLSSLIWPRN
ncbi:MAG: DUF4337 family protein [Candidatus Rokubacteria bacterium]|nr:DUF4337 family protein [Candidatus Rokubacteria bacterium]